ncbi:MAG TPA: ribonuclease HII [Methylococcus sp.]|nr:ribonuclease HII [Methylococcus sp.]
MRRDHDVLVAGVDEAGRGSLAGPVIAAAVLLAPNQNLEGIVDSKCLAPARRWELAARIRKGALAWSVGRAEVREVERLNVLHATLLAMRRALLALPVRPNWVRVDGNRYPPVECPGEAIVGGDAQVTEISAASILAKVFRDAEMRVLDRLYPGYGFTSHKGYPTPAHVEALGRLGPSPCHRRTFRPVRDCLTEGEKP